MKTNPEIATELNYFLRKVLLAFVGITVFDIFLDRLSYPKRSFRNIVVRNLSTIWIKVLTALVVGFMSVLHNRQSDLPED